MFFGFVGMVFSHTSSSSSRLFSVSTALSECACGCANNNVQSPKAVIHQHERRDSPPPNLQYEAKEGNRDSERNFTDYYQYNMSTSNAQKDARIQREQLMRNHLPSGLSVEMSEPELESTGHYS
jgi:hypothetical protein